MDFNWQSLITGAITVFAIAYFSRKAVYAVKEGELKFGLFMKGLGGGCLLFSVVPLIVFLTGNYQVEKPGETIALIGLTIGFGLGAIYTIIEGFFVKGTWDRDLIFFSTPWTGEKNEKWANLKTISLNKWCYWYVLKFDSGEVVRISLYLGGHGYLLDFLSKSGHDF